MANTDALIQLMESHGLLVLFPLAILEGPIVTVLAAWLARLGYLDIFAVLGVCILADLVGDAVLYGIGRSGMDILPETWRRTIGADERRMTTLAEHYRQKGGRTLLLGKLTHSLGFAVLMAAGVARMPLRTFLGYNLMGTVPKTALFAAIGWSLGQAHASIDGWIGRASLALLVVATIALVAWFHHRKGDET